MNISTNTLSELKCSECGCYLSRTPIYMEEDGTAICGRCPIPKVEDSNSSGVKIPVYYRMIPYENLIKDISFPCMYENNGCTVKMLSEDLQHHEEKCNYRSFMCPFVTVEICNWIGKKEKLIDHVKIHHRDRLLEHPCIFKHDYKVNSSETYVTIFLATLFVINSKVCLTTNRIYYNVNCFGDISDNFNMKFKLVIERETEQIIKIGKITSFNPKENLLISCGIQSLVDILNGFDKTNFTINIERKQITCIYCKSNVTNGENVCETCNLLKMKCNKCEYKDFEIKTEGHALNFCKFTNWCWICNVHLIISPFKINHYDTNHKNVVYAENTYWVVSKNDFKTLKAKTAIDFIIDSKYDRFFGYILICDTYFLLKIYSSTMQSEDASKLNCQISIKNNNSVYTLVSSYNFYTNVDWSFKIEKNNLFLNENSSEIKVEFFKK